MILLLWCFLFGCWLSSPAINLMHISSIQSSTKEDIPTSLCARCLPVLSVSNVGKSPKQRKLCIFTTTKFMVLELFLVINVERHLHQQQSTRTMFIWLTQKIAIVLTAINHSNIFPHSLDMWNSNTTRKNKRVLFVHTAQNHLGLTT